MHVLTLTAVLLSLLPSDPQASLLNADDSAVQVGLQAELGFLGVLKHTIQFSQNGSTVDYVKEGGQDVLFPFARLSADLNLYRHHTVTFLYQPLQLATRVVSERALSIDNGNFAPGKALDLNYGFTFWRATYLYELLGRGGCELGLGGGLQIRDAVIDFTDTQAGFRRSKRNIGPVPVLKARGRATFVEGVWGGAEVDGFWAPIKYINGSGTDVNGAILDASLRVGVDLLQRASPYINLRYLGGGASGTAKSAQYFGDGYSNNWLHFVTLSLGVELR